MNFYVNGTPTFCIEQGDKNIWFLKLITSILVSNAYVQILTLICFLFKNCVGEIEDVVEVLAEDVEKVAVLVDKVATKIADVLPEDSIIENDFVMVEYISEEFIKESEKVEQFINKVRSFSTCFLV